MTGPRSGQWRHAAGSARDGAPIEWRFHLPFGHAPRRASWAGGSYLGDHVDRGAYLVTWRDPEGNYRMDSPYAGSMVARWETDAAARGARIVQRFGIVGVASDGADTPDWGAA